mmetsp:Transcript_3651/g.5119  ORF Transcript_3651/g.5119 Transcript_3651/m.5119 type:complete len:97 (-) Transcript_3651:13-303(-)
MAVNAMKHEILQESESNANVDIKPKTRPAPSLLTLQHQQEQSEERKDTIAVEDEQREIDFSCEILYFVGQVITHKKYGSECHETRNIARVREQCKC